MTPTPQRPGADDERVAELGIRARDEMCNIEAGTVGEQACKIDRRKLLRLLDNARAEIARLRAPAGGDLVERARALEYPIAEYLDGYEFRGDYDHKPTDNERALLDDAIAGLLGSDEFCAVIAAFAATIQREAREAGIEEAAAHHATCPGNPALRTSEAARIRALADRIAAEER